MPLPRRSLASATKGALAALTIKATAVDRLSLLEDTGFVVIDRPAHAEVSQGSSGQRSGRGHQAAWLVLALVSLVWIRLVRDAWRLRSIIEEYQSVHGGYDLGASPWPDHLRVFHGELLSVGADYFYPFAWGLLVAVGLVWIGAAALATVSFGRWRLGVCTAGASTLGIQLVLFGPALSDYVYITD